MDVKQQAQDMNTKQALTTIGKGLLSGYIAMRAMNRATTYLYGHEDARARQREDEARGGRAAYLVAAEKMNDRLHLRLSRNGLEQLSQWISRSLGLSAAVFYAFARKRNRGVRRWNGLAFGAAFFGFFDEGATVALGLAPGPMSFPWQTHARGLIGHLIYGFALESTLKIVD